MCNFDARSDRLLCAGDLVNRGPQSVEVLRFIRALGPAAATVLGNHDLHLLAIANGHRHRVRRTDTLDAVLSAPDGEETLCLAAPAVVVAERPGYRLYIGSRRVTTAVGRGTWRSAAPAEVECILRGDDFGAFLDAMYGGQPDLWSPALSGWERARFQTNSLTRLRYCKADGRLALKENGPLGSQAADLFAWFDIPQRRSLGHPILFGHWSTLTLDAHESAARQVYPLDTGCVWGGRLTALRLDDMTYFSVDSKTAVAID